MTWSNDFHLGRDPGVLVTIPRESFAEVLQRDPNRPYGYNLKAFSPECREWMLRVQFRWGGIGYADHSGRPASRQIHFANYSDAIEFKLKFL